LASLIKFTPNGIYCPQANVYIDPWRKVDKALITHGHSDHARKGNGSYLCHDNSVGILKHRLGKINVQGIAFGKPIVINGITFTFFPAGHVVGSAQIKVSNKKESWVISGDYKVAPDEIATAFEPVPCDYFITESTFGIPAFQWDDSKNIFADMNAWWSENKSNKITSIICAYSLGKAQRVIQGLDHTIGPVLTNASVENINEVIRHAGLPLKKTSLYQNHSREDLAQSIIVCPSSAVESIQKEIKKTSVAVASGWMALRGMRRRRNADKGFVLSDHADWKGLNEAVKLTGAEKVYVTHGYTAIYSKWLESCGIASEVVETSFEGEQMSVN